MLPGRFEAVKRGLMAFSNVDVAVIEDPLTGKPIDRTQLPAKLV